MTNAARNDASHHNPARDDHARDDPSQDVESPSDVPANEVARPLTGKWAVVTGSSRGIGKAIALELASAGSNVAVHGGHDRAAADATARELQQQGVESLAVVADLATPQGRARLTEQALAVGNLAVWINNAGVDVLTGPAADWPFQRKLQALWQVDVTATMLLSREIGAQMKKQGAGAILNIGWDQTETGMAGDSGEMFAAVKGAVTAFTRSLAKSLAPEVRVNCLTPGWIRTAWGNEASDYWQQRAIEESLLERWGTPQEVAAAARFLVSPAASFINGQVLNVNGGSAR